MQTEELHLLFFFSYEGFSQPSVNTYDELENSNAVNIRMYMIV